MIDLNRAFETWFNDKLLRRKPVLRICVCGPTHPHSEFRKRTKATDYLREEGYKRTFMLEEVPGYSILPPDIDSRRAWAFTTAHAILLIFTLSGKNQGVAAELQWIISHPNLAYKATVINEVEKTDGRIERMAVSQAFLPELHRLRIGMKEVSKDNLEELLDECASIALSYLYLYVTQHPEELPSDYSALYDSS